MKSFYRLIFAFFVGSASLSAQSYFPPNTGFWDTISPQQLAWCTPQLSELDSLLNVSNTRSFIILQGGKIAYEKYFQGYGPDSVWYWASAGKTLLASLIGMAQDEGLLDINDKSSDFLGRPWTSMPLTKEDLIRIEDQLMMTTGIEYQIPNQDCKADSCLSYRADAGTQWFYHNAPYLLLHDVLEVAAGTGINFYTTRKYFNSVGLRGLWFDNVFYSNARAMARFGLLMLNNFQWAGQSLILDTAFINQMKSSSQAINPAYGYLTWLNGKSSFIQPGFSFFFPGAIITSAPSDLYMAAGKNDQRIYMVPSLDLVVIRQGEAADSSLAALSGFDRNLWTVLQKVICAPIGLDENQEESFSVFPNPSTALFYLQGPWSADLILVDSFGRNYPTQPQNGILDISHLPKGLYTLVDREKGLRRKIILK